MTDINTDALQQQLARLQNEVTRMAQSSRRKATTSGVIMLVLVLFTGCYMTWAWYMVDKYTEAPTIIALLDTQVTGWLDQSPDQLRQYVKENVPGLLDAGEKYAMDGPKMLSERGHEYIKEKVEEGTKKIESEFYDGVIHAMNHAKAQMTEANAHNANEADFQAAIKAVASDMHGELTKTVDTVYNDYTANADSLLDYLHKLGNGTSVAAPLDRRDQLHRDLLTTLLALLNKYDMESSANTTSHPGM